MQLEPQTIILFFHLAGFVIGLGAVTVIDWHGFLARKSSYWTEATIRSHKVTKPLIWLGTILALISGYFLYRNLSFDGVRQIQLLIAAALILNGSWLSFWLSPRLIAREKNKEAKKILPQSWQRAITISFLISFTGWWTELLLLTHLLLNGPL